MIDLIPFLFLLPACATQDDVPAPVLLAGRAPQHLEFFRRADGVFSSRNPRNGLEVQVDGASLAVGQGTARFTLGLERVDARAVGSGVVEVIGDAVVVRREGIEEWTIHGPTAVEQGFVVARQPTSGERLELVLAPGTGWTPSIARDASSIAWLDERLTARFTYEGLAAFDVHGRSLASSFAIAGANVVIRVDVHAAEWPVTIDPLIAPLVDVAFAADDQQSLAFAGDLFGRSVAALADHVIVGAPRDDTLGEDAGAAYVYVFDGTSWNATTRLLAATGAAGDLFGHSVDLTSGAGATLRAVVGAPGYDGACSFNPSPDCDQLFPDPDCASGAAFVFVFDGTQWSEEGRLEASDAARFDQLGWAVAIDGDTAVAGVPRADDGCSGLSINSHCNSGAAYVFARSGSSWTQDQKITASDAAARDWFGLSIDIDADRLAVGASCADAPENTTGAVYVYERSGGPFSETQKLVPADADGHEEFGCSVALDATGASRLIAGARFADSVTSSPGGAYVYRDDGSGFSLEEKLRPTDGADGFHFGEDVALVGDRALVGSRWSRDMSGRAPGAAYLFEFDGARWNEEDTLRPNGLEALDQFGFAVALGTSHACVSAILDEDVAGPAQGALYLFDLSLVSFSRFCEGDGGDQSGCSACPCANDAPEGTLGGCTNSAGTSAQLLVSGEPRVSADTLRFEMSGSNPSTFAVLASADNRLPNQATSPCFGLDSGISPIGVLDGLRCIGGGLRRHGSRPTDGAGDVGVTTNGWGPPNGPSGGLIAQGGFAIGETRQFQVFYRENAALVCATGQNTSDAVSVVIAP